MASISWALRRINDNPLSIVDQAMVERACSQNHYHWRKRELDPATTLALFMQQVLHGNAPCSEVRHIAGRIVYSAGVLCGAGAVAAGGLPDAAGGVV